MAEVYKLSDARRPSLESGSYELEASWNVKIDGEPEQLGGHQRRESERMDGTETFKFDVAGERFCPGSAPQKTARMRPGWPCSCSTTMKRISVRSRQ
jgi:hypothetical protein